MVRYSLFSIFNFCIIVSFITSIITSIISLNSIKFLTNSLYTVFLKASFSTTLISFPKSAGVFSNLSISNLSGFDFKLTKSTFLANVDVSKPAVSVFLHN